MKCPIVPVGKADKIFNTKNSCSQMDIEYSALIFSFIDNVKPQPDKPGNILTPIF
jgi:hypothetical protein